MKKSMFSQNRFYVQVQVLVRMFQKHSRHKVRQILFQRFPLH